MPEKWTGDVVALMHVNQISNRELAKHLNVSPAYISMVLNGHKKSAGAEARFRTALNELIANKGES